MSLYKYRVYFVYFNFYKKLMQIYQTHLPVVFLLHIMCSRWNYVDKLHVLFNCQVYSIPLRSKPKFLIFPCFDRLYFQNFLLLVI